MGALLGGESDLLARLLPCRWEELAEMSEGGRQVLRVAPRDAQRVLDSSMRCHRVARGIDACRSDRNDRQPQGSALPCFARSEEIQDPFVRSLCDATGKRHSHAKLLDRLQQSSLLCVARFALDDARVLMNTIPGFRETVKVGLEFSNVAERGFESVFITCCALKGQHLPLITPESGIAGVAQQRRHKSFWSSRCRGNTLYECIAVFSQTLL
mmetsp:Transcript_10303/g.21166  ORF Transcript_10303/g.21166 Transcript_10303/m.21166 type:complete len:212 (-) Transcript_10303:313-948(-)